MSDELTDVGRARRDPKVSDLANRFTYHEPKPGQGARYNYIRGAAHMLAEKIVDNTPASREQALALTKLEEAVFWANASIARNE